MTAKRKPSTVLCRQDAGAWAAAVDWANEHPDECPIPYRPLLRGLYDLPRSHKTTDVAAYVRVKDPRQIRPEQAALLTEHFGSTRLAVPVYDPDDDDPGATARYREVVVWSARPVMGVFRFLGIETRKYLTGYTQAFVERHCYRRSGGDSEA